MGTEPSNPASGAPTAPATRTGDVLPSYSTYVKNMQAQGYDTSCILDVDHYAAVKSATELAADADTLANQQISAIDPSAFGGSPLGLELRHHAERAHQKLTGAIDLLSTALQGYSDAVTKAQTTILDADTANQQNINAVESQFARSATQTSTPIAAAPDAPAAPAGQAPSADPVAPAGTAPLPAAAQCTVPTDTKGH
jgi:hypothetical protein